MLAQDITILDGLSSTRQPPFVFVSVYVLELVCVCVSLSQRTLSASTLQKACQTSLQ